MSSYILAASCAAKIILELIGKIKISHQTDTYRQLRSIISKNLWKNPEWRNRTNKTLKENKRKNEYRVKISNISKKKWEDPEFRKKVIASKNTDEFKNKMSQTIRRVFNIKPKENETNKQKKTPKKTPKKSESKTGNKNPAWGSKWMFNPKNNDIKRIELYKIEKLKSLGWIIGRKPYQTISSTMTG